VAVADLHRGPKRALWWGDGKPVHLAGHESRALELGLVAHHHRSRLGKDAQDVELPGGGDPQSLPLPNREVVHPAVGAEDTPVTIEDRTRVVLGGGLALHEAGIVVVGNEADLLALRLVRVGQAPLAGERAHLCLLEVADREEGDP
jgi:hypothetical protein